ncbi:MAG: hypothetical protein OEZ06_31370 [Myxococcales bacterium]|nr:hypothetical protein [Myxococcales bacterium]
MKTPKFPGQTQPARARSVGAWLPVVATLLPLGCGSSTQQQPTVVATHERSLQVVHTLLEHAAANSRNLRRPEQGSESLEQQLRGRQGDERTQLLRQLAVAHLYEAEGEADARQARKHYRQASRRASSAAQRLSDPYEVDEMAFISVWVAWRQELAQAARIAERFAKQHRTARELNTLAWLLQGEASFTRKRFREAERSYRYVISMMETPLYALALYRTAECYEQLGREADADQARDELIQFGCATDARRISDELLVNTAAARRVKLVETREGQLFPARCAPKPKPQAS